MRKFRVLSVVGVGLALVLTACSAQTSAPTNVTWNSATYNATLTWQSGDGPGHVWFEHSIDGGPFTVANTPDTFPKLNNSGSAPYSRNIPNLPPEESIRYRVCGYMDVNPSQTLRCYDASGAAGGTNYTSFTTGVQPCTRTVAAGTDWSTASAGLTAGQKLCLSAGAYNWGDFYPQAGLTISGNANTTITGEARLESANIALRHLVIQAADDEDHAVIDMRANNGTVRNVDVNTRHIANTQGIIVGGADATPSGVRIYDSKVHGARPVAGSPCFGGSGLSGSQVHAIYWGNGTNGKVERNWLYDYSGFGLHIYAGGNGTASGLAIDQVISDSSASCSTSLGNVFNDIQGPATANRTIVQGGGWLCITAGMTVTNSRASEGFQGCPASGTNTTASTTFENPPSSYRVPGNPNYQFVPGP